MSKAVPWSVLGRLHDLTLKLISMKGIAFLVVLLTWAINGGAADSYAVFGFLAALLGIREYGKVKLNGK